MTNKDRRRIIERLETQPTDTDNAAQFVDWYKEDVPLLMDVVRACDTPHTVDYIVALINVVKVAREWGEDIERGIKTYGRYKTDKQFLSELNNALRVLDGKE